VEGGFEHGNTVRIVTAEGREIARGIANYSATETRLIMGAHTNEIASILGGKPYDEVVHRDNMVLLV
jgi:glutamate 5-kinase